MAVNDMKGDVLTKDVLRGELKKMLTHLDDAPRKESSTT